MKFKSTIGKGLTSALSGLALSMAVAMPTMAADFVMKISTPTINDLQHEWMKRFETELEKATEGRIDVQLFPASQLGPIPNVIEGLQLGTIEANITPSEFYVGVDPRFQVPAAPGLFESMEDARNKLYDPKVRKHLLNMGVDKGIVGISLLVYGPQGLATREPIKTLADLSGKRIRVLASDTEIGTIKSLGAAAVPMPLNEVSASLQQGGIDGTSTVLDVFVALKIDAVAPNVLQTGLWYLNSVASVSKVWFDALPKDLQDAIFATAKRLEPEMFERQLERDKQNKITWTERGGKLVKLSSEEQKIAQDRAAKVAKEFLEANPAVRETYELIKNAGMH